ncbi:disulfide bond formation protein B [Roseateles violae]|uniref:Disulfide bond formation protein B n=1 Tax=Roseateles violae TaxID=3058042 RepID=A0ABT8DTK3_9BURK|nr:disulfide bond formation protein B [Pelomonas sp. PFR6]MDN3920224.1 disulfide bond formation protein B [Pelomonas sp. PFR6]
MSIAAPKLPARVLAGIAIACLAAVGFALAAQHGFGVKPCPWCVLQRGVFLLIAAVAGLGWLLSANKPARGIALLGVLALALAGIAAAVFQHQVAAQMESCVMTFADRTLTALNLEELLPSVFMVTASCAEAAAYRLLGLPYEIWSGLLYGAIALASLVALKRG